MPEPAQPAMAQLQEIQLPDAKNGAKDVGQPFDVQFNPETLRVTYTNTIENKDQTGGGSMQYVAKSATKLAVELWFDVTTEAKAGDVRDKTSKVGALMQPKEKRSGKKTQMVPPGVRFHWGTFLFEGVIESMDETLELFSPEGRPLRAHVTLSLTTQAIQRLTGTAGNASPGTEPRTQMRSNESVQQAMGREGRPEAWPQVAAANGIENPRFPRPGQFIDVHAGIGIR
jgi:hypothetical protein